MAFTKVYNKGKRPIVWKRGRQGTYAIHPGKFDMFGEDIAKKMIATHENACSEDEWKSILQKKAEDAREIKEKVEANRIKKQDKK